ncbi:MAG: NUDIX hydrolase [Gammaproteobacteria bacterium]|nr:NUDIX hydrolase [Gammaproteobacteria bacterium]
MPIQYRNKENIPQSAALALSYQDAESGAVFFLLGVNKDQNRSQKFLFPGGQVDRGDLQIVNGNEGEAYLYAAKRELAEETGIDLRTLNTVAFDLIETKRSSDSRGFPKDVHFYKAHLGKLNHEAITKLKSYIGDKDDLKEVGFRCQEDTEYKSRKANTLNHRYMTAISRTIKISAQGIDNSEAIMSWLDEQRRPAASTPWQFFGSKDSSIDQSNRQKQKQKQKQEHKTASGTSSSFDFCALSSLVLMAVGIGVLLFGLINLNPVGLVGIIPLLAAFELHSITPASQTESENSCKFAFS